MDTLLDIQITSSEARGKRLRALRTALRFTRQEFSDKYNIPAGTIRNWEEAHAGGLTEKGALKMISAFQNEGVNCRLEWLFYGIGDTPVIPQTVPKIFIEKNFLSESTLIQQELRFFQQLHKDAVYTVVPDDKMLPIYSAGDYVAGECYFDDAFDKALGHVCIVQTIAGDIFIRLVESKDKSNRYVLTCSNLQVNTTAMILKKSEIYSLAPIIWIRKSLKI